MHFSQQLNFVHVICLKRYHAQIFRLYSYYTGLIFGPVRKSIRYNLKNARGNRIGPDWSRVELFTLYRGWICYILVFVWQKQPSLESKRMITRFLSKNGTDPLNSPFTLGVEHSEKLSDTGRITFGIGAFQVIIVTKILPDQSDQV